MLKTLLRNRIFLVLLGVLSVIIFLEIAIRFGGLAFSLLQEYRNRVSIKQKGTYRIMCLGESTTAGGEDPYPFQLEEVLNQRDIGIKFSVINKGVHAVNTNYIVSHLEENIGKYNPDMVITMMGANDMGIKYYEDIPERDTALFNRSRTYRLIRSIWKDLMDKLGNPGLLKSENNQRVINAASNIHVKEPCKEDAVVIGMASSGPTEMVLEDFNKYIDLGNSCLEKGRLEEAEEAFKNALKINPNSPRGYNNLGHLYNRKQRFQEAEKLLKKALEFDGSNGGTYVGLGSCYTNQSRFKEAEEAFRKALELNGENDSTYVGLGFCYTNQSRFKEAEEAFKKALEINPNNGKAYAGLVRCYTEEGKSKEAEEYFIKAIDSNPNSSDVYYILFMDLGRHYKEYGNNIQAEAMFKKALALDPNRDTAYIELIFLYRDKLFKNQLAEELFNKAIALNSLGAWSLSELARFYKDRNMLNEAELLLKKAIAIDPSYSEAFFRLGEICFSQGEYQSAETFFKKAIESDPAKDKAYGGLIAVYRAKGSKNINDDIEKLNNARLRYYSPLTRHNYQKTKEILDKRGIKLVCMQYPMRDIEKLEKMFGPQDQKEIIFIDNEKIFRDALKNASTGDYFMDLFAGDFGHCTHKGNRLIAEHIADIIVKEVFHR